ncbi:c-type cytochrome [Algoriphagus sp. A40]|uniref:c-type cytochrome n=1 Tax=Algoriphagus sp. A40 TaxID=1945863 RepID=UPI0009872946|nr:c-type cytochrome [Algoriphagus sp. A40]OOG74902.1 cytochrome C [Algoriphagus sp. A40]
MDPKAIFTICLFLFLLPSCETKDSKHQQEEMKDKPFFIVPGEDEEIDPELIKKGEVLVAYSDCYQCHREESKAKGPSFSDIASRYPIRQAYIDLLARKVISGGSGTWGYPVMSPHPKLNLDDAKEMVAYILSLEKK